MFLIYRGWLKGFTSCYYIQFILVAGSFMRVAMFGRGSLKLTAPDQCRSENAAQTKALFAFYITTEKTAQTDIL